MTGAGGERGFGRSTAVRLAREGADVASFDSHSLTGLSVSVAGGALMD